MISVCHEGKLFDFHYKKHLYGYKFYIGDIFIGLVMKNRYEYWTAINHYGNSEELEGFNSVTGFGNRYLASVYLLRLNSIGGYGEEDKTRRESIERLKLRMEEKCP